MVSLYLRYGLFESLSWSLYIFVMVSLHFRHGLFLYICHGLFISSLLVTFYLFVYICLLSISRICPVFVPVYLVIKIFIFLLIFASYHLVFCSPFFSGCTVLSSLLFFRLTLYCSSPVSWPLSLSPAQIQSSLFTIIVVPYWFSGSVVVVPYWSYIGSDKHTERSRNSQCI